MLTESEKRAMKSILYTMAYNSFNDLNVNDSISCSGICLTVVHKEKNTFTVQLVKETLDKTNAKSWYPGDLINLERSLLPNTRLSGHFVQRHVDTTAIVKSIIIVEKTEISPKFPTFFLLTVAP